MCASENSTNGDPAALRRMLSEIGPGGVGIVVDVLGEAEDTSRLKALGICQGRRVRLMQAGDPLIVEVLGTRVGLSSRLATNVRVRDATAADEVRG